jgi:hypothetical protein
VSEHLGGAPDLDLLADFAAGLLDGTPEGAAVAERVASDAAWTELYAALVGADEAVRADLAAVPVPPLPVDVAERLDAALAAEASRADRGPAPGAAERATLREPDASPVSLPDRRAGESAAGNAGAGKAGAGTVTPLRRKSSRWQVATGAVAASVLVLTAGVVGWQVFTGLSTPSQTEDSRAVSAPEDSAGNSSGGASPPMAPRSAPGLSTKSVPSQSTSGTDYRASALRTQVASLLSADTAPKPQSARQPEDKSAVPPKLRRLAEPDDLASCLTALGIIVPTRALDYASYDGTPALVVVTPASQPGSVDVAIVGPDCGKDGSHTLLRTTVQVT